jgi:hypothetical protein
MTILEDSISFVPPERYGFKIEGACQYIMPTLPSEPLSANAADPKAIAPATPSAIDLIFILFSLSFNCSQEICIDYDQTNIQIHRETKIFLKLPPKSVWKQSFQKMQAKA